jgi:uncharacterized protein YdhG (YjbR/CyaY superfamily)
MANRDPVETFLNAVPEPQQAALRRLRAQIAAAAPGAEQVINYGVPMFRLNGKNLVSLAAAKAHCSFYVQSPKVMQAFAAELTGFETSRGAVKFQPERPIPATLVKRLVKARIAENAAAAKPKRPRAAPKT